MSPLVDVDQSTYEKLLFASRLLDMPPGDVVRRLTDRNGDHEPPPDDTNPETSENSTTDGGSPPDSPWVPVHKIFKGHRIDGEFNMRTFEVRILSDPWGGKTYSAPTNAAVAVVDKYSPGRASSNTNGRTFWVFTDTGDTLRSVMGKR